MRHLLHQFLWQLRRRRVLLVVHAALWVLLTMLIWVLPVTEWDGDVYFPVHMVLLGLSALLALETAGADPARGTDSFWRTRPPRWRTVCLGQALFVIVALAGPALGCWLVNGLMLDQTVAQWRAGLTEPVGIVCALLVLTGLRSVARGWTATVVALGVAAGFISAGVALREYVAGRLMTVTSGVWLSVSEGGPARGDLYIMLCVVPAAAIVVVWTTAMRGRVPRWVAIGVAVSLIAGPALVWKLAQGSFVAELQLAATVTGETAAPGEQVMGVLKLRGVPKGVEAAILRDEKLTASWPEIPEGIEDWSIPRIDILRRWGATAPEWLTTVAGQRIRTGFPATTRWYSDSTGERKVEKFVISQYAAREPLKVRMRGEVAGKLFGPAHGLVLKLEEGREAASNGTRIQILEVKPGSRNLQIVCAIWQPLFADGWEGMMVNETFVLHLPSVPAAILLREYEKLSFRSLHCASSRLVLNLTMPDAEFVTGKRFTPDVLTGAELWHFAPGEETIFEARPEEKDVMLYPEMGR